jgi:hypothetical protein
VPIAASVRVAAPTPALPRKRERGKEGRREIHRTVDWFEVLARPRGNGSALPLPLAGEGWGGGTF